MGERLVFKCIKNNKCFATLYFHWSGYTESIYDEARMLVNGLRKRGYNDSMTVPEVQMMLADILYEDSVTEEHDFSVGDRSYHVEMSRGGICGRKTEDGRLTEFEAFEDIGYDIGKQNYDDINRSDGLIDITEDGIKNAIECAGALEAFDFDYETFTNNEFSVYPKDDCDWIDNLSDIPRWEPDERYVGDILWDDADAALKWFKNTPRYDGDTLGVDENGNPVFATE